MVAKSPPKGWLKPYLLCGLEHSFFFGILIPTRRKETRAALQIASALIDKVTNGLIFFRWGAGVETAAASVPSHKQQRTVKYFSEGLKPPTSYKSWDVYHLLGPSTPAIGVRSDLLGAGGFGRVESLG